MSCRTCDIIYMQKYEHRAGKRSVLLRSEVGRRRDVKLMPEDKAGRPPKFRSVKELQKKIEAYFKKCEGTVLTDSEGFPMLDREGNPVMRKAKPPTVTGLALALGFHSRQSLLNYQGKPQFEEVITVAKSMIEEYTEEKLFDKNSVNGAKFSLSNNFSGWSEKHDVNGDIGIKRKLEDLL